MQFKNLVATIAALSAFAIAGPAYASGTMNFNAGSGNPRTYTEGSFKVTSNYSSSGHLHFSGGALNIHTSCCSTPYRFEKTNGATFTMVAFDDLSASGTLTASNGTTHNLGSTSGTVTLPAGFANVTYVDWSAGGGNIDNVVWTDCVITPNAGGPYTVNEGSTVAVSASGSSASGGTISAYGWDLVSGGAGPFTDATGVGATFSAASLGGPSASTVGVQVTCSNSTATDTATVTIDNVAPTVSLTLPTGGVEGTSVSFSSTVTDPGVSDVHTYLWRFGDGNTSTAANPSHTYLDDSTGQLNGEYAVTLTVNDGDTTTVTSGTTIASGTVVIANVAPTVASLSGPSTGDEGSSLTFAAVGTDPSSVDSALLTYSWDWDDGTAAGAGTSPSHSWADDAGLAFSSPYTVTLTVTDPQGATDTSTQVVTVGNVPPTIDSTAPAFATEGTLWSYSATATDPGADPTTWSISASAPATMTVAPLTGTLEWTPVFADVGTASVTIIADDGDGGQDLQTVTITVGFIDDDLDGLADTWETDNGLDPTIDDSGLDPDLDGLTNLDEFLGGTDPNSFDGPDVPVQTSPIGGEEVDSARPTLAWDPANDPNNDPLTYDVEVYDDAAMTNLLAGASGLSGLTWDLDNPLTENTDVYWRVRAADGFIAGAFSGLESFFVNEINEAPGFPTALFPVDGETVAVLTPEAQMAEATDVDRDALGYRVRVWLDDQMVTEGWMPPAARDVAWTVDVELTEDTWYAWDAQAEDEHGLAGDWIEAEPFFVSTGNAAPLGVVFLDPLDGDIIEDTAPTLEATEGQDPEGSELIYVFEIDTSAGFDGAGRTAGQVAASGTGSVVFDLAAEGHELDQNTMWHARVRAEDDAGIGSAWDVIEFFVRGDNDAPPTPTLISPEDGAVLDGALPTVAVSNVEDPEGDTVFYEFTVARDAELTDVLGGVTGLVSGSGLEGTVDQTTWELTERVNGTFYWSARAVDERGAASEWAEAWSFSFDDSDPTRPEPDADGCDCESSLVSADNAGSLALLLLAIPALRRRRS